jgi:hypothetical protein
LGSRTLKESASSPHLFGSVSLCVVLHPNVNDAKIGIAGKVALHRPPRSVYCGRVIFLTSLCAATALDLHYVDHAFAPPDTEDSKRRNRMGVGSRTYHVAVLTNHQDLHGIQLPTSTTF